MTIVYVLVPQLTANITLIHIVNFNTAEISIDSISSAQLCGNQKYVTITALNMNNHLPNMEDLRNLSTMIITNNISLNGEEDKIYTTSMTYAIELNQYMKYSASCDWPLIDRYLNQPTTLSVTLADLNYFTQYSVMVHLCNERGCGNASNPITIQTDEYIPTCPPHNVTLENITSTSVLLTWDELPQHCSNGIIIGFNISLTRMRYGTTEHIHTMLNMSELQNLASYEYYCMQVSASTQVGIGPFSEPICVYTNEGSKYFQHFSRVFLSLE